MTVPESVPSLTTAHNRIVPSSAVKNNLSSNCMRLNFGGAGGPWPAGVYKLLLVPALISFTITVFAAVPSDFHIHNHAAASLPPKNKVLPTTVKFPGSPGPPLAYALTGPL